MFDTVSRIRYINDQYCMYDYYLKKKEEQGIDILSVLIFLLESIFTIGCYIYILRFSLCVCHFCS